MIVVVPYRADGGHRDTLWQYLNTTFWPQFDADIRLGESPDGPFNRSAAINHAAHGDWDIAVIADADTWVPANQLHDAIAQARETRCLVAAFTSVIELAETQTTDLLSGKPLPVVPEFDKIRVRELETQSSMLVVPRTVWNTVGGFDTRFKGWGGEDNAFWRACAVLTGPPERVDGNAFHLWHPPSTGKHSGLDYTRNVSLWRRYQSAHTPTQMRRVLP